MIFAFIFRWDMDPYVFTNFPYIRWYSVCWMIGLLCSLAVTKQIFSKDGKSLFIFEKMAITLILSIIVGSRLGHVLFYDPVYYMHHPIEILPFQIEPKLRFSGFLGLASHGGAIGAIIGSTIISKKYDLSILWLLDRLVIAASLLGGFIRLGNFMNSEIIGIPATVPWSIIFVSVDNLPRHPSQLYEAIAYFLIFLILYLLYRKSNIKQIEGKISGIGLILIFSARFIIEFTKINQSDFEALLPINMGQLLSLPFILLGFLLLSRNKSMNK